MMRMRYSLKINIDLINAAFIFQPTFKCMTLKTTITEFCKNFEFCAFNIIVDIRNFVKISIHKIICLILNKTLHISVNIDSIKRQITFWNCQN